MNIAPVGLKFLFSKTNFKGNFKNPDFKPWKGTNRIKGKSSDFYVDECG